MKKDTLISLCYLLCQQYFRFVFPDDLEKVFNFGISVNRNSVETTFSSFVQTQYGANPTSFTTCAGCFPAGKVAGAWC